MKWFDNLFRHSKNKDPATFNGAEGTGSVGWYQAFGLNPDGTPIDNEKYIAANLYNLTLARTCINKIASEVSKAVPKLAKPNKRLEYVVAKYPNALETISQFLYHITTLLLTDNNCFIVPIYFEFEGNRTVDALWAFSKEEVEVLDVNGRLWCSFDTGDGHKQAVPYEECAHLKRMQYHDKLFGENNDPFKKMGWLYEEQLQRSLNSLANNDRAAKWIGKLNTQIIDLDDMKEQKMIFNDLNFMDPRSNFMIYDSRYERVDQVKKNYDLLSADDVKVMQTAAYNYWGVSEKILQNSYNDSEWYAFYQSGVQPILEQIGQGLTKIVYSRSQILYGENNIDLTSLQYSSVQSRLEVAFSGYDRGMLTKNDALRILNLPEMGPEGDVYAIRGEYRSEGGPNGYGGRKEVTDGRNNPPDSGSGTEYTNGSEKT